MLKLLLPSILVCLSISASAQYYGWSKSMGGSGADTCAALAVDNQANLYILGSFTGTGEFRNDTISDKLTSSGNDDIFLQKRNKKGKYIFSKKIGGKGIDRPSNMIYYKDALYITGNMEDTVDFGIEKVAPKGKRSVFLAKMDTLGKCIWVKTIGDSALSRARSLAINKDGIYLSGEISGKVDNISLNNTMFIQKRDFNGAIVWTKTFGSKRNVVSNALALDSLGNIYNVGALLGANVDFNPASNKDSILSTTTVNTSDIFVQKLSANGDFKWTFKMGSTTSDEAASITIKGNELFIAGNFSSTVDFDPSNTGVSNLKIVGGTKDIFVGKYDLNGKFIWIKQIGSASEESAKQLEIDKYKNVYLCGTFSTKNGTTTDFMGIALKTPGNSDAFLVKFNTTGKAVFARTFSGTGTDFGGTIKADTMQNIYVAGSFNGTINLDPTKPYTSVGTNDVFIFKSLLFADSDIYFSEQNSQSSLYENSMHVSMYPNPASDKVYFTFNQLTEPATIAIASISGQTIKSKELAIGQISDSFEMQDLTPGIYFVNITSGKNMYTYKLNKL